jgi:hypothetical protein
MPPDTSCGSTPSRTSDSTRFTSGVVTMSCPPTTNASHGGRYASSSSVTQPTGGTRPARSANSPLTAVAATDPLAPFNHKPIRSVTAVSFRQRACAPVTRQC